MKRQSLLIRRLIISLCLSASLVISAAYATGSLYATTHQQYPTYPKIHYGTGAKAKQIKRGEYLVKLGDCIACHTTNGGKAFTGGRAIETPFGNIYTPNLTPDKATGLGNWTDADFIKAMRKGVSPQGKYYYPALPYLYFSMVTNNDLKDIKAYLDALEPVHKVKPKNDLIFPFNWRFLQLGWRIMFFHPKGAFKPDPTKSAQWNRGYYIVQGLGHCGMCHTPGHHLILKKWNLGAPIRKYDLTGAFVQGFYAPNITYTNLKHASVADLAGVFLKDHLIGGGQVKGPMEEANHDSLMYLHPKDIAAITAYLKTVKSQVPPKPKMTGGPGQGVYESHCSVCHAVGAGGAPKFGDKAAWMPLKKKGLNILYKNAINGINGMPAKGACLSCTNKQIQDAVRYMLDATLEGTKSDDSAPSETPPKPLTLADGEKIYTQSCSACHNTDSTNAKAPKTGDTAAWMPLIKPGFDVLMSNTIHSHQQILPTHCKKCNDAQIKAAIKYMLHKSKLEGNYKLW
ncbi:MAG: c-type cytochrome [Gammaproteobacteria bacterium]|nr:c-type cytochrome [Gammaproteobacteria bacterium]